MVILKAIKMFQTLQVSPFHLTTDKTVSPSHRNIHMAVKISGTKAFILNIFFL